jgi:hypothetical protein
MAEPCEPAAYIDLKDYTEEEQEELINFLVCHAKYNTFIKEVIYNHESDETNIIIPNLGDVEYVVECNKQINTDIDNLCEESFETPERIDHFINQIKNVNFHNIYIIGVENINFYGYDFPDTDNKFQYYPDTYSTPKTKAHTFVNFKNATLYDFAVAYYKIEKQIKKSNDWVLDSINIEFKEDSVNIELYFEFHLKR